METHRQNHADNRREKKKEEKKRVRITRNPSQQRVKSRPLQCWKSQGTNAQRKGREKEDRPEEELRTFIVFLCEYLFPTTALKQSDEKAKGNRRRKRRPIDEAGYIQHRDATCTEKIKIEKGQSNSRIEVVLSLLGLSGRPRPSPLLSLTPSSIWERRHDMKINLLFGRHERSLYLAPIPNMPTP